MKIILPGSTIGIIGGGQLGRMLALSAKEMGYKIATLDPSPKCCARVVSDVFIQAEYHDYSAIEELFKLSDVVTFEFENVDANVFERMSQQYYSVQSAAALRICQHRLTEKEFARSLEIPTVAYYDTATQTVPALTCAYIMKTVRFGYDGKGQQLIHHASAIEPGTILEEFIPLDKEISVVAVKDREAVQIVAVIENEHRSHILYRSKVPTSATPEQEQLAKVYTERILAHLDYYGVLTVEFFIHQDGRVLFNEIAPRVHNSGHITMQSATKSQFRAHIEAICGLPVGMINNRETTLYNILGQDLTFFKQLITQRSDAYLHLYEKAPCHNRKIGHVNFYGDVQLEWEPDKGEQNGK